MLRFFRTIATRLRHRWKLFLFIALIATVAGIIGFRRVTASEELTFISPKQRDLTQTITVSGVVDADTRARMRFLAGGKLTYLGVSEGERVERWDLLGQIDQRTLQKQLEQDLNLYLKERWDWEDDRQDTEYSLEELETRRDLDRSQWDLENSVLNVEIRDIAIDNTRLYAPFDGIVTTVPVHSAGIPLTSGDYFEIVDPESLVIRAQIDEADIAEMRVGQPVTVFLDAYRDDPVESQISYISYRSSETSTGTVYLADIPLASASGDIVPKTGTGDMTEVDLNSDSTSGTGLSNAAAVARDRALLQTFRLGMNGDIDIIIDTATDVLAVPLEATRLRDGATYVDVRTGPESYEAREIEVGLETDDYVEVRSGLSTDDEILLPEGA